MKLREQDIRKLENFLQKIEEETYAEEGSELHNSITEKMLNPLLDNLKLPESAKILDVGCGQGVALKIFEKRGYKPIGITLNDKDVFKSNEAGFNVKKMDQSFLDFPDESFHLIWARHVLEHSIFPYFTLSELFRVLVDGGIIYIEVPAPGTTSNHENNPNHYSVLTIKGWQSLIRRSGFDVIHTQEIKLELQIGEDIYYVFIGQKKKAVS